MMYALFILYMPVVTVATYSGRSQTEKDRLAEAITEDIVRVWKVQKKDIVVVFQEAPHGNWYASGIRL
jgi:4-oxalocrotonate tautomerase